MKIIAIKSNKQEASKKLAKTLCQELGRRQYTTALWQQVEANPKFPPIAGANKIINSCENRSSLTIQKTLTLDDYLAYLTEDFLIIDFAYEGVPNINYNCEPDDFSVVAYDDDADFGDFLDCLIAKTPKAMPFPINNPCCGVCGYENCQGLLKAIISGKATLEKCTLQKQTVTVKINEHNLSLVQFAQDIVRSTNCGLLSTLDGFQPNSHLIIEITESC